MALKYIPYGYGDCRLEVCLDYEWEPYEFGVLKIISKPKEIIDRFINNKGNYRSEREGYRISWDLELVQKNDSALGNQLHMIHFLNDYWRRSYEWLWLWPQFSSAVNWVENQTIFKVLALECPSIADFKVNKKLGQKLVIKFTTRDLIPFGVGGIWTPYRDTDGNWGGYEPAGMGIMNETFDNV